MCTFPFFSLSLQSSFSFHFFFLLLATLFFIGLLLHIEIGVSWRYSIFETLLHNVFTEYTFRSLMFVFFLLLFSLPFNSHPHLHFEFFAAFSLLWTKVCEIAFVVDGLSVNTIIICWCCFLMNPRTLQPFFYLVLVFCSFSSSYFHRSTFWRSFFYSPSSIVHKPSFVRFLIHPLNVILCGMASIGIIFALLIVWFEIKTT